MATSSGPQHIEMMPTQRPEALRGDAEGADARLNHALRWVGDGEAAALAVSRSQNRRTLQKYCGVSAAAGNTATPVHCELARSKHEEAQFCLVSNCPPLDYRSRTIY